MTTNSGKTCKSLTRKYLKEFIKGKKNRIRGLRRSSWKIMFMIFCHLSRSWKENLIDRCLSRRSRMKCKWFWISAIQGRILCLEGVLAKSRTGTLSSSLSFSLRSVEFYEGEWWCFCFYFKAPKIACSWWCKNRPTTLDAAQFFRTVSRKANKKCIVLPLSFNIFEEKDPEQSKEIFREFQEKFKKVCPATPVFHVENDTSTASTVYGEHSKGSPLSCQLPSVDCIGNHSNI